MGQERVNPRYTGRMLLRANALMLTLLFGALVFSPNQSFAADCPLGEVLITTAADRAAATAAGIPTTSICWRPNSQFAGREAGEAKQILDAMWCGGRAARCGPYTSSIEQLDPRFAVCAARFLQEVRQRDPTICIASAHRSAEHQEYLCRSGCGRVAGPCAPAGQSRHQSGRAVDIQKPNYNTLPAWVHHMARQGGNISFPVNNDDGHMEPANLNSSDCASAGYVAPGNGGGLIASNDSYFRSGLQSLGYNSQPPLPPQPILPPQPLAQQQPLLNAFQPTTQLIPSTNTQTGVSGQISTNTNQNTGTSSAISVADRLLELAFGTSTTPTTSTGNATSVPLVIIGASIGSVAIINNENPTSTQFSTTGGLAVVGQQTFVSNDLRWQPQQPPQYGTDTYSRLVQLYTNLKEVLVKMLEYLRPFGGGRMEQTVRE